MDKAIIADAENCTGCRICELICSMTKQGEFNPRKSSIQILTNNDFGVYLPVIKTECDFCGECVEWCPMQVLQIVGLKEAALMRAKSRIGSFPVPVIS